MLIDVDMLSEALFGVNPGVVGVSATDPLRFSVIGIGICRGSWYPGMSLG